MQNKAKYSKA